MTRSFFPRAEVDSTSTRVLIDVLDHDLRKARRLARSLGPDLDLIVELELERALSGVRLLDLLIPELTRGLGDEALDLTFDLAHSLDCVRRHVLVIDST